MRRAMLILIPLVTSACIHRAAQRIVWPAGIEQATGVGCRAVLTAKATGGCEDFGLKQGTATWWRSCGFVNLPGNRSEQTLKTADSFMSVARACDRYIKKYMELKRQRDNTTH